MILDKIVATKKERLKEQKKQLSLEFIREKALAQALENRKAQETADADALQQAPAPYFRFGKALKKAKGLALIAELKKASPSKGLIRENFDYVRIAQEYEAYGASCLSVLTEEDYFLGSPAYLKEIREKVKIPLLRKDFIIDPYQIYEAVLLGADAILLIARILEEERGRAFYQLATSLGLDCLFEVHNEAEVAQVLRMGAQIVGVNNRDLSTFQVDLGLSERLGAQIPPSCIKVSESGLHQRADLEKVWGYAFDAVLVGEALMRSENLKETLAEWMQAF